MTFKRPNVLLITVDCMRRDRVSAYGYERETTPFLDGMLDRSIHCTSAHSVSSWTCPAVGSLLTGLYPHHHGGGLVPGDWKNLSKQSLPSKAGVGVPLLPDLLRAHGYGTAAIGAVWNAHLAIPPCFDEMTMIEKPARRMVRRALRWIGAQQDWGRPFFLWLHLGDPHEPLDVPRSMRHVFGHVPHIAKVKQWDYTTSGADVDSSSFVRYREARIRLYDAAVRATDRSISHLWSELRPMRLDDRTLVVVTADHGEEFWEHRQDEIDSFSDPRDIYGTGHGHNLFQVHVLVPLVLWGLDLPSRVIGENVSLVDAMPTVLQAVEVEGPQTDGHSLLDADPGHGPDIRPVLAEGVAYGYDKQMVVVGDHKLLSSPGDGYERTFRLGSDRREERTVQDAALTEELRRHLPSGGGVVGEQVEATEDILEHLRALGYIE